MSANDPSDRIAGVDQGATETAEDVTGRNAGSAAISADTSGDHHLILRNTCAADYDDIAAMMDLVYHSEGGAWSRKQFAAQLGRFPEGQLCIEDKGRVVAAAVSMVVDYERFGDQHTYHRITGRGFLTNHDPSGDTLYGVDVLVHPDYRAMRLGRRLYDARKELAENLELRRIIIGGRIPGYRAWAPRATPAQYIEQVRRKEIHDPVLSFQLANDFHVRRVVRDYWPSDVDSGGHAVLLEWNNIYYDEQQQLIGRRKSVVRVGVVQWQMRSVSDIDDLLSQVAFFVDAVASYKADFVLFPELFNAPLLAHVGGETPADAMRALAAMTEQIREAMVRMAVANNIHIIAGSMPEYRDGALYNVSWLCRRDGSSAPQYKLHITPDEAFYWGLQGGNRLEVFDTDAGRVGILVCYDVQFPELSRLLANRGIDILFVPFWTDTRNAYLRVRHCAMARAIENEIYVVIAGNVGNLPNVENMDIQYAQSAVFTPSDFAFSQDAIAAEATPNTETTLIVDLDVDLLRELRRHGSVRNRRDRRADLVEVRWIGDQPLPAIVEAEPDVQPVTPPDDEEPAPEIKAPRVRPRRPVRDRS